MDIRDLIKINMQDIMEIEPLIHSHITDCLPDDHPLCYETVSCDKCGVMVHAGNNECMQTWFETDQGNFCSKCFKIGNSCMDIKDD